MKFQFIANACGIFISDSGKKILCDPWLNDGVFDGSWCHFHPLSTSISDVQNVDAIYLSHLHQDHYDDRFFDFRKDIPIFVLDHGANFLSRILEREGYTNIIKIKDGESYKFEDYELTLYAPFAKHNFHEAKIGNLIDSAILLRSGGVTCLNANDNTPTVESVRALVDKFGKIDMAMINYNAAGPYPACFDNLSKDEKRSEHERILNRNFDHMVDLVDEMKPTYTLPFAGAYVLGGFLASKNPYLGTTTWDNCKKYVESKTESTKIVCLREGDIFDISAGVADKEYVPIDDKEVEGYIDSVLSKRKYPYENDTPVDMKILLEDLKVASGMMKERMSRYGIENETSVWLNLEGERILLLDTQTGSDDKESKKLECTLDSRLLRRILDKKSHWNNAEIGCHVTFKRTPNIYEPDLHTALQFLHL